MAKAAKHTKKDNRPATTSSRRKTWTEKMHPGREAEVKKTDEQYTKGIPIGKITPFWKVVGPESPTAKKLSFTLDFIRDQRAKEHIK